MDKPRRVFLSAQWRHLLMLNYEVAPELLQPFVPAGTTLDLWQGKALVSVVGFRFLDTKVLGISVPGHRNFDEINLRFYVRRKMFDGQVRRGVTFVRELVPRLMIARIAKLAYNEPYSSRRMRSVTPSDLTNSPGRVSFSWRHARQWNELAATAVGGPAIPPLHAEASFITEHYWGYTRQRNSLTVEYQVEHPQWRVWNVESAALSAGAAAFFGPAFEPYLAGPPRSAFLAEGSPVLVYKPTLLLSGT